MIKRHLWVLMSALPFPLWNKDFLIGVSNSIGIFVALEKYFHQIFDKRIAKVLVELDVSKGLLLEIEIIGDCSIFTQILDYLNIPFRCNFYHETIHLKAKFPFLRHGLPLNHDYSKSEPSASQSSEPSPS